MTAVVLVVGRPAAGKTTMSRRIGARFGLPLIAKDRFKELLFDSLGPGDREWSRRLGWAAFDLLDDAVERQLGTGGPFVVEANFDPRIAQPRWTALRAVHPFTAVQVHCTAPDAVLLARFAARSTSGERHAAHLDADHVADFAAVLGDGRPEVLDLGGPVLRWDSAAEPADAILTRLDPLLDPLLDPKGSP